MSTGSYRLCSLFSDVSEVHLQRTQQPSTQQAATILKWEQRGQNVPCCSPPMGRAGTQHGLCFLVSISCSVLTLRHNPPISYGYSIKIILEKWKDFSFECFYKHILVKHYNGLHHDIFTCVYKYLDHIYPPLPSPVHLPFSMIPFFRASGTTAMCHHAWLILLSPGNVLILSCHQHYSVLCGRLSWLAG